MMRISMKIFLYVILLPKDLIRKRAIIINDKDSKGFEVMVKMRAALELIESKIRDMEHKKRDKKKTRAQESEIPFLPYY